MNLEENLSEQEQLMREAERILEEIDSIFSEEDVTEEDVVEEDVVEEDATEEVQETSIEDLEPTMHIQAERREESTSVIPRSSELVVVTQENAVIGMRVFRGPDWRYSDQDFDGGRETGGHDFGVGSIVRIHEDVCHVRWGEANTTNCYRIGSAHDLYKVPEIPVSSFDFIGIEGVLNHVLGNERWDKEEGDISVTYYLHYPRFDITSTAGFKHTITDLFVRLCFSKISSALMTINGIRASVSKQELLSGYNHSHLSDYPWSWGTFCFGGGPITSEIAELRESFNADTFEIFLHGFQVYLEYESTGTNPYKKIGNLGSGSYLKTVSDSECIDAFTRFIGKYDSFPFTISSFHYGIIEIDPLNEEFMNMVLQVIPEELQVMKSDLGVFYSIEDRNQRNSHEIGRSLDFVFKGEEQVFKLNNLTNEQKKYAHPIVCEYISRKLSRECKLYAAEERSRDSRNSNSEDSFKNLVSTLVISRN